jgi:hypothetical protein
VLRNIKIMIYSMATPYVIQKEQFYCDLGNSVRDSFDTCNYN